MSSRYFVFRLSAVKLASINIACMTVDNAAAGRNGGNVGEDGRKISAGAVSSSDAGAEAKAALHSVMLHFLTSSSL